MHMPLVHYSLSLHTPCDINSKVFPLLSLIAPLAARAFPEFLVGKYIVGFDTISYYVPVTLRWISNGVNIWEFIGCAPLFYSLLAVLSLIGVPLTVSLKILPPFIHGFLGLAVFFYAEKTLAWSYKKSLFASLLATLYFVSLRISWDMLRCELGLIFLFVFLILLHKRFDGNQWKSLGLLSLCMIIIVLAHQLVATIMFIMVLAVILKKLADNNYGAVKRLVISSVPAAAFFMVVIYAYFIVLPSIQVVSFASSRSEWIALFGYSSVYEGIANTLGFFIYCYLPLLPFAYIGVKNLSSLELKAWSLGCLITVSSQFLISSAPASYRWILLLVFPIVFFAVEGFERVNFKFWKKGWAALLILLSFSFIFLPAEMAFPYFRLFPYYLPSSMLQNSVPLSDCADIVKVLNWIEAEAENNTVLLVHAAFHGWALLCLNNSSKVHIVSYGYASPREAAQVTHEAGYSKVYLVWWLSGKGWHGLASLPSCFVEIFHSGRIAAYEYVEV